MIAVSQVVTGVTTARRKRQISPRPPPSRAMWPRAGRTGSSSKPCPGYPTSSPAGSRVSLPSGWRELRTTRARKTPRPCPTKICSPPRSKFEFRVSPFDAENQTSTLTRQTLLLLETWTKRLVQKNRQQRKYLQSINEISYIPQPKRRFWRCKNNSTVNCCLKAELFYIEYYVSELFSFLS